MGVEGFRRAFPKARAVHVKALKAMRDALCEVTMDDNKPATLSKTARRTPPKDNPLKRAWLEHEENGHAAEPATIEVTLAPKKRAPRAKPAAAPPPPADQEEEEAVCLHRCKSEGGRRQYLVEWADTWTDGHQVRRQPHHNIGARPRKGVHLEDIERVVETRQNDRGKPEYKVKWAKTWEPEEYLVPKAGGTSALIAEFYQDKTTEGSKGGGERKLGEALDDEPAEADAVAARKEETHMQLSRLLTIQTLDAKPDKDVIGTGKATMHVETSGGGGETGATVVYDGKGRYVGQLTHDRVAQRHRRYTHYKEHNLDDPPDTFPEELARLLHMHTTGATGGKSATGKVKMTNH
mmetsp:Transcript_15620/g.37891  ORF Transcript_15620/g.37891 Transcript_15620/m.37891 type:complete len:350 (+) Transcript_15620:89-1138(+)